VRKNLYVIAIAATASSIAEAIAMPLKLEILSIALVHGSVGLRALKKIIMDRCDLVLHSDGVVRAIGEPQPKISLAPARG
jgi:hypothetical protein